MNKSRVVVTGGNGQLGTEFKKCSTDYPYLNFKFIDIEDLDITDADAIKSYFNINRFDYLVNCAAYTAVDKAEEEPDTAFQINAKAVQNIINSIRKEQTRLIHISTDYVFDGKGIEPYKEDSQTNPQSVYGKSKLEGEKAVQSYHPGMVIRTSWLYSSHSHNFVKSILKKGAVQKELRVVADQVGTPTYAGHLAQAILTIIDKVEKKITPFTAGIFHYTNEDSCSWYDFAVAIKEETGLPCEITPVKTEDFPLPAKRPFYSVLSKEKISTTYKLEIPHWKEGLRVCLEQILR